MTVKLSWPEVGVSRSDFPQDRREAECPKLLSGVGENELYFVIVNYYSTELIKQLLASIPQTTQTRVSIIIVNNSPDDNSVNQLLEIDPRITLIHPGENLGFGRGCNLGIEKIYSTNLQALIWLINPDATLKNHSLDYVISCFEKYSNLAILGTRIVDTQGNLWFSQGQYNCWTGSLKHASPTKITTKTDPEVILSRWVSGCSLILNLAQFDHCPQFDPHYFLYYEDSELCERYYQKGYQIGVTQAVLVTHVISATSQNNPTVKFRHATYSKLYFLKQHGTFLALILNLSYILFKIGWLLGRNRCLNHPTALGYWQGLKQFLFSNQNGE